LIEVLVVVAIIALLVAVLMPSLKRARDMARMVQCQSNLHQLTSAFVQYTVETKGRLPGSPYDPGADWLGWGNTFGGKTGRQPDDGTVWKYMGKARMAYHCPQYGQDENDVAPQFTFNYCMHLLLSGALPENLTISHHPLDHFKNKNHRASAGRRMAPFQGTPMLIEEDTICNLTRVGSREGGWCYSDSITDRHLRRSGRGYGNLGFTDGHVGKIDLPPGEVALSMDDATFNSYDMCFRTKGGKWVSGWSIGEFDGYGFLSRASDASQWGITH
jgi:prepilin-type processing-associated H-X9-DG protein